MILTEKQQKIKEKILDELGLLNFRPGRFQGEDVRKNAAATFAKVLAKHTMDFEPIAYSLHANELFLFILDIAEYGDIGVDDVESTQTAIEFVIDTLFEIYPNKDDEYRKEILGKKLKILIASHPLFRPHLDSAATMDL